MAKGGEFERDFCRELTTWWTGDQESDVVFWRTAMSGGRATVRRKKGKKTTQAHCGDIAALTLDAQRLTELVTFELKRGYNGTANLHNYLDPTDKSAEPAYSEWILQARAAAEAAETPFWAIVHRRDRRESMGFLKRFFGSVDLGWLGAPSALFDITVNHPEEGQQIRSVAACPLSNLLESLTPRRVLRVHEEWLKRQSSKTASPTSAPKSASSRSRR
jgi:hypothetical protein